MLISDFEQLFDDSDPLEPLVEHGCEQFLAIKLLLLLLILSKAESEVENVVRHRVHDDALIVTDFVLQVDDALVLKVSVEHFSQTVYFCMQLALVVIVVVMLEERLILGIRRRRVSHLSLVHSTRLLRLI